MLKQQIENLIQQKNQRRSSYLDRDMRIILEYFGFGQEKLPTLENIGEKENLSRQYVGNDIIKTKFQSKVSLNEIPALLTIWRRFCQNEWTFYSDLLLSLIEENLVDEFFHLKGFLNLLECFNLIKEKEFDIYTLELKNASKQDFSENEEFLIVHNEICSKLKGEMRIVLKHPGKHGIGCLNDLYKKHSFKLMFIDVTKILKSMPGAWCYEYDQKFWYLNEKRENHLITLLKKIRVIGNYFKKDILIDDLENALRVRSEKNLSKPPKDVIRAYLENSKYVTVDENHYGLQENLPLIVLTPLEQCLIEYMKMQKSTVLAPLRQHLQLENPDVSRANLHRNIFHSPFLLKKPTSKTGKEGQRYEYVFIGNFSAETISTQHNDYEEYRRQLASLYDQTDIDRDQKGRREQPILRAWLFKNKKTEKCAICGKEYSIESLVAAHKKPRAKCSENERTDPYIVMPVCKFGCDQIYEKRWIKIDNGVVSINPENISITKAEQDYIESIKGKHIPYLWLRGNPAYFK